jgi:hypothetical protein
MQKSMSDMDKLWIATASLLHPATAPDHLVTVPQIRIEYQRLFGGSLSTTLVQHLVSWKPRNIDKDNPSRGGSRNRYFFRTDDGATPSPNGGYRLYKSPDITFDGVGKDGPTCPRVGGIGEQFHFLRDWYLSDYQESAGTQREIAEAAAEAQILASTLSVTEKESLVKSRRGQGIFKRRVVEIESACRLTGVTEILFLVASHIKPWADSSNHERLDGFNGLLLSPHVDMLFDSGFITFKRTGEVVIAVEAVEVVQKWRLTQIAGKPLNEEQEAYMQYHRENIFRGNVFP